MKTIAAFLLLGTSAFAAEPKSPVTCPTPSPRTSGKRSISTPGEGRDPVVFWIHRRRLAGGDKTSVQHKPQAFVDKGFVFVSTNYRLLPHVDMGTSFAMSRNRCAGSTPYCRVWRRSQPHLRHGAFRGSAACRADLH